MKRLFISFSVLAIVLIALSWTNRSANAKMIAVYNIDSVLVRMPQYDSIIHLYMAYERELHNQEIYMKTEYQKRINDFNRDSVKFSPLIVQIKKAELQSLDDRISEFRMAVEAELDRKKDAWLLPLKEKIKTKASELGKSNGYLAVISMEGYIPFIPDFDPGNGMRIYYDSADIYSIPEKPKPVLVNQKQSNAITWLDPKIKTVNITKEIAVKMGLKP